MTTGFLSAHSSFAPGIEGSLVSAQIGFNLANRSPQCCRDLRWWRSSRVLTAWSGGGEHQKVLKEMKSELFKI